jgi:predicted transcriptional regulator
MRTGIMKLFKKIPNPREIRQELGLNQLEFWSKVGVTQSGGSRYESGREIPKAVRELVRLVHIDRIDLTKIKRDDLIVAAMLKAQYPDLYKSLKKSAKLS